MGRCCLLSFFFYWKEQEHKRQSEGEERERKREACVWMTDLLCSHQLHLHDTESRTKPQHVSENWWWKNLQYGWRVQRKITSVTWKHCFLQWHVSGPDYWVTWPADWPAAIPRFTQLMIQFEWRIRVHHEIQITIQIMCHTNLQVNDRFYIIFIFIILLHNPNIFIRVELRANDKNKKLSSIFFFFQKSWHAD